MVQARPGMLAAQSVPEIGSCAPAVLAKAAIAAMARALRYLGQLNRTTLAVPAIRITETWWSRFPDRQADPSFPAISDVGDVEGVRQSRLGGVEGGTFEKAAGLHVDCPPLGTACGTTGIDHDD